MRFLMTVVCFKLLVFSSIDAMGDQAEALLSYIPPSVNGLAIVRVQEILNTPLAKREQWRERPGQFLTGAGTVPTWTDVLVMGGLVHPGSETDNWSVAVLPLPDAITMDSVAQHENTPIQKISGVRAVLSKRNAYFLELAPQILGVQVPAMRQEASRWVRQAARNEESSLSGFLMDAAAASDHIIMALDMQDMLDPELVRHRLEATPSLRGKQKDSVSGLAEAIAQLRGVTFTANIDDRTHARIVVHFSRQLPSHATWLATVFLELLNDQRMALRDFEQAKVTLDGERMVLRTELSEGCLRQIMLLLSSPFPDASPPPATSESRPGLSSETDQEAVIRKNRRYYAAVNRALNDLERNESWSLNYAQTGGWVLKAADKIDNLSISGIDPELVSYGADVSSKLRALAASLHGMLVEVDAQEARTTFNWRVTPGSAYGDWGSGGWRYGRWRGGWTAPYWNVDTNLPEVRQAQAEAVTHGARERAPILQSILDQRTEIRQLMQSRYGVDFERRF